MHSYPTKILSIMCIPHTHTNKHEDKQPHLGYSKMGGEVDERARVLVCKPHPASGVARRSYAKHASIPESVVGKVEMARLGETAIQIQTSTYEAALQIQTSTFVQTQGQAHIRFRDRNPANLQISSTFVDFLYLARSPYLLRARPGLSVCLSFCLSFCMSVCLSVAGSVGRL
jgi:hypothetical protein